MSGLTLAFLVASRWLAFPASVAEQDEAYFVAAALDFAPESFRPHPPWFPLWVGVGWVMARFGLDPGLGLRLIAAAASVLAIFPLVALGSRLVRRRLATAMAVTVLMTPGLWLLSGAAFTEVPATVLLLTACCLWWPATGPQRWRTGSLAAALAVLVRPHLVVAALPLALLAGWGRSWRVRSMVVWPAAVAAATAAVCLMVAAGGIETLATALEQHATLHLGQLEGYRARLADWGLVRALGSLWAAAAWLGLVGIGVWTRPRRTGGHSLRRAVTWGGVVPLMAVTVFAADPTHTRYWLPPLLLSAPVAALGAGRLAGQSALPVLLVAALASAGWGWPAAREQRLAVAPPVAAVQRAFEVADQEGAVLVADRTLHAFVELERLRRAFRGTLIWDVHIAAGELGAPPPWATVLVTDRTRAQLPLDAGEVERFSVRSRLLRRLGHDRYLEVVVAQGVDLGSRDGVSAR